MKRIIAVLLAVMMILLAGCGKKADVPDEPIVSDEPVLGEITDEVIIMEGFEEPVRYQKISNIGGVASIKYDVDNFSYFYDAEDETVYIQAIGNEHCFMTVRCLREIGVSDRVDEIKTQLADTDCVVTDNGDSIELIDGTVASFFWCEHNPNQGEDSFMTCYYFVPYDSGCFEIMFTHPGTSEYAEGAGSRLVNMVRTFRFE